MSMQISRTSILDGFEKGMSLEQIRGGLKQKQKELDVLVNRMESYRARNMEVDRKRGLVGE